MVPPLRPPASAICGGDDTSAEADPTDWLFPAQPLQFRRQRTGCLVFGRNRRDRYRRLRDPGDVTLGGEICHGPLETSVRLLPNGAKELRVVDAKNIALIGADVGRWQDAPHDLRLTLKIDGRHRGIMNYQPDRRAE